MLYRLFHGRLAGRLVFIAPAIVATAGLLALRARVSSSPSDAVGLDMEVLRASGFVTLAIALPILLGLLAWAGWRGTWPDSATNLLVALAVYPVWGIGQQAIFQGLMHRALQRLGLGGWAIPLVAVCFALVHPESYLMLAVTLAAGLVWSAIFHRYRNILPIGVAHGLLGALFYYLVLERDVIASLV